MVGFSTGSVVGKKISGILYLHWYSSIRRLKYKKHSNSVIGGAKFSPCERVLGIQPGNKGKEISFLP
jgi:hypothetical protein